MIEKSRLKALKASLTGINATPQLLNGNNFAMKEKYWTQILPRWAY